MTDLHESLQRSADTAGPSDRSFGIVFACVFGLIAVAPRFSGGAIRWWSVLACAVFLAAAVRSPGLLSPLNRLWLKFGLLLHALVSPVVLGIMFFLVLTPMGLLMRALGKKPLQLRFEKSADSYWIERRPPGPKPESLRDQF